MTLSAIGEAETPAGGSVCIRYAESLSAQVLTQAAFDFEECDESLQD